MPRTLRTVHKVINQACDEIIAAADLHGTGTETALNLLVNATMSYLEHSATDLKGVARRDFGVNLATLLEWIATDDAPEEPSSADQVISDEPGRFSTEPITTGDGATDVPTTIEVAQLVPLPPVIDAKGTAHPGRKHLPRCGVWNGLDCTCAQLGPKKKGGGSRG